MNKNFVYLFDVPLEDKITLKLKLIQEKVTTSDNILKSALRNEHHFFDETKIGELMDYYVLAQFEYDQILKWVTLDYVKDVKEMYDVLKEVIDYTYFEFDFDTNKLKVYVCKKKISELKEKNG